MSGGEIAAARRALVSARTQLRRLGRAGMVALGVLTGLAVLSQLVRILPFEPNQQHLELRLAPPLSAVGRGGWEYLLGADQLGRPLMSRLLVGGQISLTVGFLVPILAILVGVPLGLASAVLRGKFDLIAMRIVDIWMSLPPLLLALVVLYLTGPGFIKTVFVLAALRWMVFARLTRALGLSIQEFEFVEAARATGATRFRIMLRHILPSCRAEILVLGGLESARAILAESALSFLGLGIQPPESSWGTILGSARSYMVDSPWLIVFPGAAIVMTTLSINVIVDSSRKMRRARQ